MSGRSARLPAARRRAEIGRTRHALWLAALLGWAVAGAQAQEEGATAQAAPAEDESQRVDESEESFRARMELREQRLREQQRGTPTFSYSASRDGKLANLPPESQEHIRAQLRDMVIESRTWKPGEDLSGYPYEPSPAAAKDPGLARQEREAFIEQLEKYQQREAAHAAAPSGEAGAPGEPGDGNSGTAAGSPTAATAGVTESALEFLKQQGKAGGSETPPAGTGAAQGEPAGEPAGDAAEEATGASAQLAEANDGGSAEQEEAAPAGTVAIAELARLDAVLGQGAPEAEAAQDQEAGMTLREVPEAEPEPGTLDIEALQRLDPDLVGARSAEEGGQ